ncbi:DEAD/DEAH box helicase [Branchiibius hedensis]|nr:type ISP restriction/modification enzyme [Branchiibius hedensis]
MPSPSPAATAVTIYDVLDQIRASATSEYDKGDRFERLMVTFLRTDPTYADQFTEVWRWKDWPGRDGKVDTGIDLVAVDRLTGGNVAIQCKFYAQNHHVSKADLDGFLAASGTAQFTRRIIVSTGADWGSNAEAVMHNQTIPVTRIGMAELASSSVDWSAYEISTPETMPTLGKNTVRPYQRKAIDDVLAGFEEHDRGKLIMACGTGKTYTSLRLAEELVGAGGRVLFLVPSISLLSQTVPAWANNAQVPLRMLGVCSDPKASKATASTEDISSVDMPLPATTNVDLVSSRLQDAATEPDRMTVVFSTYQSIQVVSEAIKASELGGFDLIVCDEAHRTTGVTLAGVDESAFVKVHDNTFLPASKRLYMTATPRIFGEASKGKAKLKDAVLASMDDEALFGPELHRLGFGEAVSKNLLTDYRVLILTVDERYVSGNFQSELAEDGEIQLSDAAKIIGCWNGLAKHFDTMPTEPLAPMQRAVAFLPNIKTSKAIASAFPAVVERHIETIERRTAEDDDFEDDFEESADGSTSRGYAGDEPSRDLRVECEHIDGTFNALERNERLEWLKAPATEGVCRVLTNARCLSEGVDVPALDAVMFLTPRGSEVDIVQSVGRVMRRAPGKDYGYIILPVAVPAGEAPEKALADNKRYSVIWQVLNALRSHDDRFNAEINKIDLNKKKTSPRIGFGGIDKDGNTTDGSATQEGLDLDFGEWRDAIYAKIVQKVGDRKYWENWAGDVAVIAQQLIERLTGLLGDESNTAESNTAAAQFDDFLEGLRGNLNDSITRDDAIEMLAQHLITRPIFQSLFGSYDFAKSNPVAQIMERMLAVLDEHALDTETASLEQFYESVALRLDDIDNTEGRQRILVELYDNFFAKAFKKMVDKNGMVYTPIEIVDFILRSADDLLREHFDQGLTSEGVHILDGFTGTGTFIVRLLQLGLIEREDLIRKYRNEIHANELLLLAYYIAAVNIESAYLDARRETAQVPDDVEYEPFPGLVLTDTFQSYEDGDTLDESVFVTNNDRIVKQRALPITVIIGNPPYSSGQDSANDDNANESYPGLDASIRDTYAALSTATNKNSLYDSYIRAFRWATLRLGDRGVIAFVTNGGWIDSNTADGMRKTLGTEFSDIYVYNLRGNARTAGDQRQREGGGVFSAGSRATVAVTVLVRDPERSGVARIHYTDVGDYLTREAKLAAVADAGSVVELSAVEVIPNEFGDWINQRRDDFGRFMPIGDKVSRPTVFGSYAAGVKTKRDAWVWNFGQRSLIRNVEHTIRAFNAGLSSSSVASSPADLSWSRKLRTRHEQDRPLAVDIEAVQVGGYRPFTKELIYCDSGLVDEMGSTPSYFAGRKAGLGFMVVAPRAEVESGLLALHDIPDLSFFSYSGQFFARWRYEKIDADDGTLGIDTSTGNGEIIDGYRRIDNITDEALAKFVAAYGDSFTKDDVFHYVYGLLHSPDYRATYAADLKKMLPRIPLVEDAAPYVEAGRALMELHLGYEEVDVYPLAGIDAEPPTGADPFDFYRIQKMAFAKTRDPETNKQIADRSTIVYNDRITLSGVPEGAHRYMLGSRSAIEWIIDRYQVKTDKPSGIVNDPNDWSREVDDPRYIIDLLGRIVTVSLKTMQVVDGLPSLAVREVQ